jgi:hypothetical protein
MASPANDRLHTAASEGSLSGVDAARSRRDVNAADSSEIRRSTGYERGHCEIVQRLLTAAPISTTGRCRQDAIMNAAFMGNIGIVRLLPERGVRSHRPASSPASPPRSASSRRTPNPALSGPVASLAPLPEMLIAARRSGSRPLPQSSSAGSLEGA